MNDKIKYFLPKIWNRLPSIAAKFYEYLSVDKVSCLGLDCIIGKLELLKRLNDILGSCLQETICSACAEQRELILTKASDAKLRIFDVLGSGPITMEDINWSREIKTGYEWPVGVYYLKLRKMTPKGSDIKVPWEISRCHHLLWMAEAYCLTGDEGYAKEIIVQMKHWIEHNPVMYSVNWTCAMDVSIRAVNWMYALTLIGKSKLVTDEFAKLVYRSLYQHLFFIAHNLEKNIPWSNNHYYSDLVGLLFLGSLFSNTRLGRRSLKYAIKEYEKETLTQFFPSGVNYERSTSYHRLMTELALYTYYMLNRTGITLSNAIEERLSRAIGYVNQYIMANGHSPIVSDNDDGRLLPFVPVPFSNHSYLVRKESLDTRMASAGCEAIAPSYSSTGSHVHEDANCAIMKSGSMYLYVSCFTRWKNDRATGKFGSSHLHSDLLSFVLADGEQPLIIDPGSYCYTSDLTSWKKFRTARKHNTIIVDDEEPNILGNKVFSMKYNAIENKLRLHSDQCNCCEGEYSTIIGGLTHHRKFVQNANKIVITDDLKKQGRGHTGVYSLHFAPEIEIVKEEDCVWLTGNNKRYRLFFTCNVPHQMTVLEDTVSPSFGVLQNALKLEVIFTFENQSQLITTIETI